MKFTIQPKARCPICTSTINLHEIITEDELYYSPIAYISISLIPGKILAGICEVCRRENARAMAKVAGQMRMRW